jgi:hypothetical protein
LETHFPRTKEEETNTATPKKAFANDSASLPFMGAAPLFALLLSYVSYRLAERVIQQQVCVSV